MASVVEHYEKHLAPLYSWLAGGVESACARGKVELEQLGLLRGPLGHAVDLGAGFGMHAIPLAQSGCRVLAVDSSSYLLGELNRHASGLGITTVVGELLDFPKHLEAQPDAILCMGDTVTHLPGFESVEHLVAQASERLKPGGQLVLSFRDYSTPLEGNDRFILVKSDPSRVLTCFLEYAEELVEVHDVLHERDGEGWRLQVSSYRKLRLDPAWLTQLLTDCDFTVRQESGLGGMVRLCATRA